MGFVWKPGLSTLEAALQESLANRIPLIGVHNPTDTETFLRRTSPPIPKLALPAEEWREVVQGLVAGAEFIVIEPVSLSPGVSEELSIINDQGRWADTIVIMGGASKDDIALKDSMMYVVGGVLPADRGQVHSGSPELATFPRILSEDELGDPSFASHPLVVDLLERVEFLQTLDPQPGLALRDARMTYQAAVRSSADGQLADAVRRLQEARHAQQRLGDRIGLIRTLYLIGVIRAMTALCLEQPGPSSKRWTCAVMGTPSRSDPSEPPWLNVFVNPAIWRAHSGPCGARSMNCASVGLIQSLSALESLVDLMIAQNDIAAATAILEWEVPLRREAGDAVALAARSSRRGRVLSWEVVTRRPSDVLTESLELVGRHRPEPNWRAMVEPLALALLATARYGVGDEEAAQQHAAAARAWPVTGSFMHRRSDALGRNFGYRRCGV